MKPLRSLDRFLYNVEFGLLVAFLSAMVLMAFTQVVLRNVFGSGIVWADTIIRHLVMWSGFLGAALATSDQKHISIDALTKYLPRRAKHIAFVFTSLFAAATCFYLGNAAWKFLAEEWETRAELVLGIRNWQAVLILPVGYYLLAFHFLVKVVDNAAGAFGKRSDVHVKPQGKS